MYPCSYKGRYFIYWQGIFRFMWSRKGNNPAGIYIFKVNNRNTKTRCEISIYISSIYIVNFKQVNADWVWPIWP